VLPCCDTWASHEAVADALAESAFMPSVVVRLFYPDGSLSPARRAVSSVLSFSRSENRNGVVMFWAAFFGTIVARLVWDMFDSPPPTAAQIAREVVKQLNKKP
jgi:hypothetical protein